MAAADFLACVVIMAVLWLMLPQYDKPARQDDLDAGRPGDARTSRTSTSTDVLATTNARGAATLTGTTSFPLSQRPSRARAQLERGLQERLRSSDPADEERDSHSGSPIRMG